MDLEALYITDELKDVVDRVNAKLLNDDPNYISFKFFFGEDEHVVKVMKDMKAASAEWNPLIAVLLPIDLQKGNTGGYYGTATIPRIVIAKVTDPLKAPSTRQETIIKPFIEPFYNEFMKEVARQPSFAVIKNKIEHRQRIRFGTQTAAQGFTEYIDGMELLDIKITLQQKKC